MPPFSMPPVHMLPDPNFPFPDAFVLEVLMRGAAVGSFVGLALAIVRPPFSPARVTGALFCLAAAAHTLTQNPSIEQALGFAEPLAWAFSVMGAGLFWAFATELFGDRRRLRLLRFAPAAFLLAIGIVALLLTGTASSRGFLLAHNLVGAGLMAHVLTVVWSGWQNDLVESRRRLRGPILAAAALYAVSVFAVQTSEIFWRPASELSPLAAAVLLLLGLASIGALLRADPDLFAPVVEPPPALLPEAVVAVSDEDATMTRKLDRLMREGRVYREEALTITALALKLAIPEYKLRRLINRQLGHRNFSAFLNQWRLADAKQALADPGQREVPISTIGLDAGFQSLGPFNRAFKAETGLTPTEFRVQALEK